MAQTIKLKRSATQGAIPSTSSLDLGEVAINTYDGKMYIKKDDGTPAVVEIGGGSTFETLSCSNNSYNVVDSNNTYSFVNGTYGPEDNFFVGRDAGINTNGTGDTASYNNFIGRNAGRNNTTGSRNNFFGSAAGLYNTTGSDNNFIGYVAGRGNTTGYNNNFMGRCAGFTNSTGNNNIFMGQSTGRCNTTGSNNNFFGCFSGFCNTTGVNNNFIGNSAGFSNSAGNDNNFIGSSAGFNNSGAAGFAGANFGTAGQVLTSCGNAAAPVWADSAGGGLANIVEDTTPQLGGDLLTNGNNIHVEGAGAAQAEIKLYEAPDNGSNYVALRSNSLLFNSYTLTLPVSAGANGQVLTTDGSGVLYFTTPSGGVALTDLSVTQNTASGNGTLAYNNTSGVFTYTPPDLSSYLTSETTTTLTGDSVNQRLVFTNETGTPANIDLSWAVDDTNLARITSGSVNGSTGIATFTRDDASTFTVDFSALFDDTNLTRITSGSLSGTTLTLTRSDATTVTTDISSLDSRYLATSVANQEVNTNSNVTFGNVNINGNLNAVDDIYLANRIMHEGDTDTFMQFHAADQWRVFTGGIERFEVNNTNVTVQNDLIVNGGDITLGGTGRIQGIDTVSANTDAANKLYVDNAVAGAGGGTFETLTCSTNYGPNIVDSNNTYSFVNGTYGLRQR